MRLVLDIDGVVADFVTAVNRWVEREFGHSPLPATHWDWLDGHPDSKMVWRALWNKGVVDDHLFLECEAYPGAVEAIQRLSMGMEIVFATHRAGGYVAAEDTKEWLGWHGIGHFPIVFVDEAHHKAEIPGDFFVDDYPDTIDAILRADKEAVLFDRPWNEHRDDLPRVSGWPELEYTLTAGFEPDDEWVRALNGESA